MAVREFYDRLPDHFHLIFEELSGILRDAEFSDVRWLMPVETGFYQPIVLARRGN
jgi:hypothetical protein